MTKAALMDIAERNHMDFIRRNITNEGAGVYCESSKLIPELDAICDSKEYDNVIGERIATPGFGYIYQVYCPETWIDLHGRR